MQSVDVAAARRMIKVQVGKREVSIKRGLYTPTQSWDDENTCVGGPWVCGDLNGLTVALLDPDLHPKVTSTTVFPKFHKNVWFIEQKPKKTKHINLLGGSVL